MLSKEEKTLLRESWEIVDNNRIETGVWLFVKLFETVPGSQDLFPQFVGASIDEIWTSKKMRGHALQFISFFTNYIDLLDEEEALEDLLLKTGARHYRHKVEWRYFEEAVTPVVAMLEHFNSEDRFTEAHKAAWTKAVTEMWPIIRRGMEEEKNG